MIITKGSSTVHVEIFWGDLTADAQRALEKALGGNGNYDLFPLVEIDYEEEEVNGTEPEL